MRILLISPATPHTFWSFSHVLPLLRRKAAFPPLGLITVAAMLPPDWPLELVDVNLADVTDEQIARADCIFISGMIVHAASAARVIGRCRAAGKKIIAGGPLFTTGHERFEQVDAFVLGEAESVMEQLVADLRSGSLRRFYQSEARPDLSTTPLPRWDLLHVNEYATMPVQFSRGCPFDCEFCDITAMYGRLSRVKSPPQMIGELESLLATGWKGPVFIVDDNFIGNRARAMEFLAALIDWQARRGVRIHFTTQASLNLVDHPELLDLMVRAGFKRVFVGIESPSDESLAECSKIQNRRRDLVGAVRTIHNAGMEVMGGFIIGFDSDRPHIFDLQHRFIQEAGIVTAMVGLLTALPGTRLFTRLTHEKRIVGQSSGNNLDVALNFVPKLDRQVLVDGYRRLVNDLYTPRTYYRRIATFLRDYRPSGPPVRMRFCEVMALVRSMWTMGVVARGRRQFWLFLARIALFHRKAFAEAMGLAIIGYHFRKVAASL